MLPSVNTRSACSEWTGRRSGRSELESAGEGRVKALDIAALKQYKSRVLTHRPEHCLLILHRNSVQLWDGCCSGKHAGHAKVELPASSPISLTYPLLSLPARLSLRMEIVHVLHRSPKFASSSRNSGSTSMFRSVLRHQLDQLAMVSSFSSIQSSRHTPIHLPTISNEAH